MATRRRRPVTAPSCPATTFKWAPYGTVGVWHDNCYNYAFNLNNPKEPQRTTPGNYAGMNAYSLNTTKCAQLKQRILADYKGLAYQMKNPSAKAKPGYYKVMNFIAPKAPDFHFYRQIRHVVYKTRSRGNTSMFGNRAHPDTVQALAKFFRVSQATIRQAYARSKKANAANGNNGRIAMNSNKDLRVLNRLNDVPDADGTLKPGRIMTIPVNLWAHKQGFGGGPVIVDASGKTIVDPRKANRNYNGLNYSKFCSAYAVKCGAGRLVLERARKARRVP